MPRLTLLVLVLSATLFADANGTTWLVRPDGTGTVPTIQAGIDSAVAGDTVMLKNGTFRGDGNRDIDFRGKAIVVRSEFNEYPWCVIDCEGSETDYHRGFYFHSGEDSTSVLEGLTIKNGYLGDGDRGAGILCENASGPTLIKCKLKNNIIQFSGAGGGLFCSGATLTLSECEFRNNQSQAYRDYRIGSSQGGGIYADACTLMINDCVFYWNRGGSGGGMYCSASFVTMEECSLSGNWAELYTVSGAFGIGGGIVSFGELRMTRCWLTGNWSRQEGGGVACGGTTSFNQCIFLENEAGTGQDGDGGGVWGDGTFTDCAFIRNKVLYIGSGGGVSCGSTSVFTRCRFEGNHSGYSGFGGGVVSAGGTFADCQFVGNWGGNGGGVASWGFGDAAAVFTNCLFAGNSSYWGGGVLGYKGTLTNCTFYDNWGDSGGAFVFQDSVYAENTISAFNTSIDTTNWWNGVATLVCCDVYGNEGGDWVGPLAGQDTINGNFSSNPMFCDPDNGDLTLASISPCLPMNNDCGVLIGAYGQGCDYAVGAPDDRIVPPSQASIRAYPNPFNPSTTIEYSVPASGKVTIRVFDVGGRLVTTLVDRLEVQGIHTVAWDGADRRGRPASSGIYFVRLESGGQIRTHKIVLLK